MAKDIWQDRMVESVPRSQDVRSEWERDYARLIHSAAFRRLQSKTQVLGLGESDFYRTRLTHSMEVAQIGVGIVRWLKHVHRGQPEIMDALPDDALMSSICLAHDIGHPPFGHGGEVALNICMRRFGGFEGNGQTLRILARLDKYTETNGLNPTRRLMLGVLKYPASYADTVVESSYGDLRTPAWLSEAKKQHPPKCYLDDERDVVDWILKPLGEDAKAIFVKTKPQKEEGTERELHRKPINKSLDTSIMELADDISYSLHDLEDAISLGMVTREHWDEHNAESEQLFETCDLNSRDVGNELFSKDSYIRKNAIGELVHLFITKTVVTESFSAESVFSLIKFNARIDPSYGNLRKHMFSLVRNRVIESSNVQQLEFKGQKLVVELFEALNSDPVRLLPKNTLKRYSVAADKQKEMRVICDFIAGMTDEYATRLYEKLYYPHKGSIFDRL